EPARNVAEVAVRKGIPTLTEFFGRAMVEQVIREVGRADLLIGNNVLAQVADLNDFVAGLSLLLQPDGVATLEFPHLLRLIEGHMRREEQAGMARMDTYLRFGPRVATTKHRLLEFLVQVKREGSSVVGYGAPGKGNTLLNYCGIRQDFVDYTVDRNPYKQGRYLPGTRIPIFDPGKIAETKPDYVLILPWNFKDEIMAQMSGIRAWGGRFLVPIPE